MFLNYRGYIGGIELHNLAKSSGLSVLHTL